MLNYLGHYIPSSGRLLWVLDEAAIIPPAFISQYRDRSTLLTNRYDIYLHCKKHDIHCILSDFELDNNFEQNVFACIIFPVSREKLLSNYIIASCAQWLDTSGKLILMGKKNEGIKTYFDKLNSKSSLKKHGDYYIGEASRDNCYKPDAIAAYKQLSKITQIESFTLHCKPGIFGWQKIDEGSTLLVETLKQAHSSLKGREVIDLGCGSGYLGLHAAAMAADSVSATDNNATATTVTWKNFQDNKIVGEVVLDDCASTINKKFNLILCNPPFHKGKATESELTEKFVAASRRLLAKGGEAWFVVNAFISLEKIALSYFSKVETKANNKKFKVLVFGT